MFTLELGFLLILIGASGLVAAQFGIARNTLLRVCPFMVGVGGIVAAWTFCYSAKLDSLREGPTSIVAVNLQVAVSPQGTQVYVYDPKDREISIIDAATNRRTSILPIPHRFSRFYADPPNGRLYVISNPWYVRGAQTVTIIDSAHGNILGTADVGSISRQRGLPHAAEHHLGRGKTHAHALDVSRTIEVVDAGGKRTIIPNGITDMVMSPSRGRLYIADATESGLAIIVLDTAAGYEHVGTVKVFEQPPFEQPLGLVSLAADPVGNYVAAGVERQDFVAIINAATNAMMSKIPVPGSPGDIIFDPSGSRVYVSHRNMATVSILDIAGGNVTATVRVGNAPLGMAVDPSGRRVYVANSGSGTVSVIDTATSHVVGTIGPWSLAVLPDVPDIAARASYGILLLVLIAIIGLRYLKPTLHTTRRILRATTILFGLICILSILTFFFFSLVAADQVDYLRSLDLDHNLWKVLITGSAFLGLTFIPLVSIVTSWLLFKWRNYSLAIFAALTPLVNVVTLVIFSL